MKETIEKVIEEKVNPVLTQHYGSAILTDFEEGVAWVKLTGACGSCPSAEMTVEDVVKRIITEACVEVKDVKLDRSVSSELLSMAKSLMGSNRK